MSFLNDSYKFIAIQGGDCSVGFERDAVKRLRRVPHIGGRVQKSTSRKVHVDSFMIREFPVTNSEFEKFKPGHRRALETPLDEHPVVDVTFYEACEFCSAVGCRLPTAAEWELAARPGLDVGSRADLWPRREAANYYPSCGPNLRGDFPANAFGVFDMLGNVHEFIDNEGGLIAHGTVVEIRGGSWGACKYGALVSYPCYMDPQLRSNRVGFRLCKDSL